MKPLSSRLAHANRLAHHVSSAIAHYHAILARSQEIYIICFLLSTEKFLPAPITWQSPFLKGVIRQLLAESFSSDSDLINKQDHNPAIRALPGRLTTDNPAGMLFMMSGAMSGDSSMPAPALRLQEGERTIGPIGRLQ